VLIKILEEMRELRINQDYKNYRTLSNVLNDNIRIEIINEPCTEEIRKNIETIKKWLESEIKLNKENLEFNLKHKNYSYFKIISQCNNILQSIYKNLSYIN
jgi:hypothetical protein